MARADLMRRMIVAVGDVRPGEGRMIATFMAFTFLRGLAAALAQIAAYSMLLDTYQATILPWVYIGVAVLVTASSLSYEALGQRLSLRFFLPSIVSFNALSFLIMWLALWLTPQPWLRIALPIWIEVPFFLSGMVFWELADRIFDIRQVKRLFGRILSVGYLAGIVAGLTAASVTGLIGATHVVGLAFVASVGLVVVTIWIQRSYATELKPDDKSEEAGSEEGEGEPLSEVSERASLRELFKHPLARLIFVMVGITIVEYYIFDNVFYDFAERRYPGEAAFAAFYGTFSAAVNLASLIMMGFVTNRVMNRFGVKVSLLVMPLALLVAIAVANAVGVSGEYPLALLGLVFAGKFLDDVLTPSFNEASVDVLYQALPQRYRSRARSLADGVVYPLCAGFAGVLLLVLTTVAGLGVNGLLALLLVVLIACCATAVRIPVEYRAALRTALEKRSLAGLSLLPTDAATASMLEAGLQDESPSRVLYCLDLLIERQPESRATALVGLLDHPNDIVRGTALARITDHSIESALPEVRRLSSADPSSAVRAAAVLSLAALLESEAVDVLQPHLDDPDPLVQQSAISGLLRSGGIEGVLAAGEHLLDMSRNTDPSQRAQAASVIGAVGIPSFHRPLRALLADEAIEVRRAALAAARSLGTARLLDEVVGCLEIPSLRRPAGSALVAIGDDAIARMLSIYREASSDPALRELLLGTLGLIGTDASRKALRELLETHRAPERASLAEALLSAGVRAERGSLEIHNAIDAAGRDAAWALAAAAQLASLDQASVLIGSLLQFVDRQRNAMLSLAACIHPPVLMKRARDLLDWPTAEMRAYAVELLDNTLATREKAVLLPLIDGSDRDRQRSRLGARFPVARRSADEWFRLIATGDEVPAPRWLRCAALHGLADAGDDSQRAIVHGLVADHDPVVSSSAQFVAAGWDEIEGQEGSGSMLSIVERVIFLKAIPIFAEIPESDLVELASRVGERRVDAGTTVVSEGEIGTSMYVVVSGTVLVHRGEDEVARMGEGSVFGELAALDTQPRTASVTTLDETLLFSVDQEILYELMAEHPVMLRGVIKILCDRLRESYTKKDGSSDSAAS